MSLRIQVKPNDTVAVDYINENPVIGNISPVKRLSELFSLEEFEDVFNERGLATVEISILNRYIVAQVGVVFSSEALYIPIVSADGGRDYFGVGRWTRTDGGLVFDALEFDASTGVNVATDTYKDVESQLRYIPLDNIEFIIEEESQNV